MELPAHLYEEVATCYEREKIHLNPASVRSKNNIYVPEYGNIIDQHTEFECF